MGTVSEENDAGKRVAEEEFKKTGDNEEHAAEEVIYSTVSHQPSALPLPKAI